MITSVEEQLLAAGWRGAPDFLRPEAHSYFTRFPVAEDAKCQTNGEKSGIQVGARVYRPGRIHGREVGLSVSVELFADAGSSWVSFEAYSLGPDTTVEQITNAAQRLVAAWEAYTRHK